MKRHLFRNTIILSFIFALVSVVLYFAYKFISEQIISDTIAVNVTSVGESVTDILYQQVTSDYDRTKETIEFHIQQQGLTTTADQIAYLSTIKDQILINASTNIGFGEFITGEYEGKAETFFKINGVRYLGINSQFNDAYEKQLISFCNFFKNYQAIDGTMAFADQIFVVFRFDNIIMYFEASAYIEPLFGYQKSLPLQAYYLICIDGAVAYDHQENNVSQFFNYLRNQDNAEIHVSDLITKMENLGLYNTELVSMKIDNQTVYLTVSNMTRWENDFNIYVVLFFGQKEISKILDAVSTPLLVSFILLDFTMILVSFISFYMISSKNNDLEQALLYQNNSKIYKITLRGSGKFHLNRSMRKILKDRSVYKDLNSFKFKQPYPDYVQAAFQQRTLTLHLTSENAADETERFICFMPLRTFHKRILIGVDVTSEEIKNREYRQYALFDIHTALPNTQLLKNDISEIIKAMRDDVKEKITTVSSFVSFTIDAYEKYDIIFGPLMGKRLIVEVVNHLNELIKDYEAKLYCVDTATFGLLFKNISSYDIVTAWIEMALNHFAKPIEIEGNNLIVELYFGIFNINLKAFPEIESGEVISNALRSLSKVKSFGVRRYEVFDASIIRFISNEEATLQDLRYAIENDEFVMALQAQYDVDQMRVAGFEMLVRWQNPKYFNQSPAHFIEIAEKNSMIIPIGRIILRKSFEIIKNMQQYDITFSINISPVQLIQAGFVNDLITLADEYQINYQHIALEITETFLMENFKVINEKLKLLKKKGFVIHLDDFGTGYSSMLYLKELPIDAIKIDKEFTFQVVTDKYSREIVAKIISMAKSLSLEIIAEGVEDEKQLAFLQKSGCNIIQGYLISKPILYDEALELINNQKNLLNNELKKEKNKRK